MTRQNADPNAAPIVAKTEAERVISALQRLDPGGVYDLGNDVTDSVFNARDKKRAPDTTSSTRIAMDDDGVMSFAAHDGSVHIQTELGWEPAEVGSVLEPNTVLLISTLGSKPFQITVPVPFVSKHLELSDPLPYVDRTKAKADFPVVEEEASQGIEPASSKPIDLHGQGEALPAGFRVIVEQYAATLAATQVNLSTPIDMDFSQIPIDHIITIGQHAPEPFQVINSWVSRKHLDVRRTADGGFQVKDRSTYGTEIYEGNNAWTTLVKGVWHTLPSDSIFRLGGEQAPSICLKSAKI
jgi:hypothetical protein